MTTRRLRWSLAIAAVAVEAAAFVSWRWKLRRATAGRDRPEQADRAPDRVPSPPPSGG